MQNLINGILTARVTNNSDPDGQGRVEVEFTTLGEGAPKRWCSVASVAAGGDRGLFFMPENQDEVIVAFENGDFNHAFIIGYPWNPVQLPPSTFPNERMIRSRQGHTIRFIDGQGTGGDHGSLVVQDAHGNAITMGNGVLTINARTHLSINALSMSIMGRPVNPLGGEI
ncbi:MAG: hypothetical protein GY916_06945 [Gammaproteobacteria bacterium]|nr:hypothetical protein [Gammaproteobacteria bacterium]